jgi:hypothetical protein
MGEGIVAIPPCTSVIEMDKPNPFLFSDNRGYTVLVVREGKRESDLPALLSLLQNRQLQVEPHQIVRR